MDIEKINIKGNAPPPGYNPLEIIRGALYHWIAVPFKGTLVWCILKCLSFMELKSCGNISCLYLSKEKKQEKEYDLNEIIEILNAQEAICKLSFVYPAYDEIINVVTDTDCQILKKQEELKKIKKDISSLRGKELREAEKVALQIEYQIGFLVPDDTMSFVTAWALGADITDIKKLSRDILLDAAIIAKHWGKKPSEMIDGIFTDFQRDGIDRDGMILYQQHLDDLRRKKRLEKNKYKWKK
jgi:hypothetical protein